MYIVIWYRRFVRILTSESDVTFKHDIKKEMCVMDF